MQSFTIKLMYDFACHILGCRLAVELEETLKSKNEEGEAYISEIEVSNTQSPLYCIPQAKQMS